MTSSLGGGRRKGGRPDPLLKLQPPENNTTLTGYVLFMTYLLMAVTGLGYLALMWSTVVLLGGFVTSLQKKDFGCLTAISMMQAARIFNDLAEHLLPNLMSLVTTFILVNVAFVCQEIQAISRAFRQMSTLAAAVSTKFRVAVILPRIAIWIPFLTMCYLPAFLYGYGPIACIALALWRIIQRDYGSTDGDASKANLMPALDIFYSLVLFQGTLYFIWIFSDYSKKCHLSLCRRDCKLPNEGWCRELVAKHLLDMRARCWRDPASIRGRTTTDFAIDLLDSRWWDDNLSGARLLDAFIRQGADVRPWLLPSRPLIQKMIDTLGWRHLPQGTREMREVTARIVAHLAGDIHLAQFPGALRCISSLLQDETTLTYYRPHPQNEPPPSCNELILQGLTILERLATDHQNCMDICSAPGLLPRITAPIYSDSLIQDINSNAWANVVTRSLKLLHHLICAPGWTGGTLRREVSSNNQALSNLDGILDLGNKADQELQLRAMEVLTELALDLSINLTSETKQNLIKKQLQIFLADGEGQEPAAMLNQLKATAGRMLALLSTNSETNSALIMTAGNDTVVRLIETLDATNTITYRTIAAEILENLCCHCDLNKQCVKETLLPKVLTEILPTEREPPQSNNSVPGNDEENQIIAAPGNDEVDHNISAQGDNTEMQEISSRYRNKISDKEKEEQTATKALQEAFLSLILVIYDKLVCTDDFDEVVQKITVGHGAFVSKLKTIIQENCQVAVGSLRIVKVCGQIAVSMMRRNQYTAHFTDQEFVKSLSESLGIMSNLESCMLFAGTDFGLKMTLKPLLSDIEKEARELLII